MIVRSFLMVAALSGLALCTAAQEVLDHEIRVRIRPDEGVLEGDCTITVSRPREPGKEVAFELLDGKVLAVEADGVPVPGYKYGGDNDGKAYESCRLMVPLPATAGDGPIKVRVRYRDDKLAASATNPEDGKPFSLGQLSAARGSFCSHVPYYPYVRYQGLRADLHFTVPDGLTVVSSGGLVETLRPEPGWVTYHWRSDRGSGILPYPFACHRYQRLSELARDGATKLDIYCLPQDEEFARQKMPVLQDVFSFYLKVFGSYPFPKLAVVETDLLEGNIGLAAQSVVMLSKKVWFAEPLVTTNLSLANRALIVLADETAHQWNAYKVATPNYLAEGISRYTDSLYFGHRGGEAVLAQHMALTRRQYLGILKTGAADQPISDPSVNPLLYFIKGALALDMLRTRLGQDKFLESMRTYFTRNTDQVTDLRAFSKAFEDASGTELWWFLDQWYNRGGHPRLELGWSADSKDGKPVVAICIKQEQSGEPYRLWLPVEVRGSEKDRVFRTTLELTGKEQSFQVPVPFEPKEVDLDPERRMPIELLGTVDTRQHQQR